MLCGGFISKRVQFFSFEMLFFYKLKLLWQWFMLSLHQIKWRHGEEFRLLVICRLIASSKSSLEGLSLLLDKAPSLLASNGHNFAHLIKVSMNGPIFRVSRIPFSVEGILFPSIASIGFLLTANLSSEQLANNQVLSRDLLPNTGSSTHSIGVVFQSHFWTQVRCLTLTFNHPSGIRSGSANCSVSTRHPVPHPKIGRTFSWLTARAWVVVRNKRRNDFMDQLRSGILIPY